MEAKDTVLKKKWMSREVANDQNALLLEQAEVSFKAGQESGKYSISTIVDVGNDAFKDGYKAGIREVVEWIEFHKPYMTYHYEKDWQAKLKEWGYEQG